MCCSAFRNDWAKIPTTAICLEDDMRRGIKCACLTLAAVGVIAANAVHAADSKSAHLQAAAAAAGQDLKGILSICDPRTGRRAPPKIVGDPEPAKVFDNLYFLGIANVSAWALTTSNGIIVLDALDNPGEAQQYIEGGLRKLGLDPNQIKYVVVTHAHGDHYGGAQYLADKFHAHLVMSDIDW